MGFHIVIKGKVNEADELSRIPQSEKVHHSIKCNFINYTELNNNLNLTFKEVAKETRHDSGHADNKGR